MSGRSVIVEPDIKSHSGSTLRQASPAEREGLETFFPDRRQEGELENCQEYLGRALMSHHCSKVAFGGLQNAGLLRMFCRGSSMVPTIKKGDTVLVSPYGSRRIRCGDVVVFRSATRSMHVVHRVVNRSACGIRTVGDNNDRVDSDFLAPCDIAGQVVYVQKKTTLRRVHGGGLGSLIGGAMRLRRIVQRWLCNALHPVYYRLAGSGILRRQSRFQLRTKVVCFRKNEENELKLLWGTTPIGWFVPEVGAWAIKPPFRMFIDELSLPKPGSGVQRIPGID